MPVNAFPPPTHDTLKSKMARAVSPGFGCCGRCGLPWRFVEGHSTPYRGGSRGVFPLCESCWTLLTPEERLPYYEPLLFEVWQDRSDWADIRDAVKAGL